MSGDFLLCFLASPDVLLLCLHASPPPDVLSLCLHACHLRKHCAIRTVGTQRAYYAAGSANTACNNCSTYATTYNPGSDSASDCFCQVP